LRRSVVEDNVKETAAKIIDTHSHVLPFVDHGSPDMETTLRMLRASADQGSSTIVCTPHLYELDEGLVERTRETHGEVCAGAEIAGIPVRLLQGFEVDLLVAANADLDTMRRLCIRGDAVVGQVVVIEMPFNGWPLFFEQVIHTLSVAGITPIIAHPERNERVQRSPDVLMGCMNAGAVLQGTAGSLSPMFRRDCQKTFFDLLARGWFGLLASDAHSEPEYTWSLAPLLAELGDRLMPEDRDLLVNVNPGRVLEGKRPLPLIPRRPAGKSRRFFG
jgi:protein-tyrosine phosphatase